MMEIKTTEDLMRDGDELTKEWVGVDEVLCDIDERISGVSIAIGNQEDVGYLNALECLLDYYLELSKSSTKNTISNYVKKSSLKDYVKERLKELSIMLANYENHRDAMQKDEDTSYYDKLVLVGRARIEELIRFKNKIKGI